MLTTNSLTFISRSSSNVSDYLWTNGAIRMSWTNWMNWMKWVSEANELNEVNEVSLTNEFCEMSEQESDIARWGRNKSEWVGWQHLLTTKVVQELKGERVDFYSSFLASDVNFFSEADRFIQSGTFSGPLGDLIPLAIANVIQIPYLS